VIMADPEGESLESWLNKATNPSNRQEEWEYIIGFCDQINKELEGPQISVRLLAHKIQSPQDWESLQALTVLEACMKNCGRRFHNEVGKFRFLNELIKIVSPKYLGDRVSERVKTKVIELLYSWSVALPDEAKIIEAYQMLKKQGIVAEDPVVPVDKTLVPSPKPKNPVFDNEEKSKRLAELLKSKKPEDLQEANRIIKNMVKEVRDLYNDCDKLRTAVFRLATETDDDDSALGDILHASDDLSRVINSYKKIVEGQTIMIDIPGSTASERLVLCVIYFYLFTGKECPVTAYDKDGVRVLLHFATDPPPGRPDVLVAVVSMLNTAPLLVKNVVLQVAVPKSMKVKLQPPSGTEMAPFNPFMPPSSITQIMLLANPLKEKVRMRYKLTFILGDRQVTESGEIVKFPPVERWGHL
uniref:Golgi associated, gamma adaptin ear containing, ARF binding protein 3a n=1 Tax=Cyprinus carpio TaxID=7962 RepID=A0A8C2PUA5_CYPCA